MSTENTSPSSPSSLSSSTPQALPERPHRGPGRGVVVLVGILVLVLVAGAIVWAVRGRGGDDAAQNRTVRIGTTEASASFWPVLKKKASERGVDVEVVNFADYTQPNQALSQGQIDANYFQHLFFLANYNVEKDDTIAPLSATYVVPLGLYSKKHSKLDQFPKGARVAIPNDQTNQGRALLLLQSAGLISLRDGGTPLSTPADVDAAASKVNVKPVDAKATVTTLGGVDGAVINNGFARDAKIDPSSALFADSAKDASAQPYINVFAVRAEDKDNETIKAVSEAWHDPEVLKAVVDDSQGSAVIVKDKSPQDLARILSDLQKTVKNS